MKRYLVTGGRGYIGSKLVEVLGQENEVASYDIKDGLDIRDLRTLNEHMEGVDTCYHLAAITGFAECDADPIRTVSTNVTGTANVLEAARSNNVRVIFVSSISTKEPTRLYSHTKKTGEELCNIYNQVACRLSNVYGGDRYLELKNSVVAKFIKEDVITIDGLGRQKRDFIYLDDVIDGLIQSEYLSGGALIDICTGVQTTIHDLAHLISDFSQKVKTITYRPGKVRDSPPTARIFDTKVSLEEGILTLMEVIQPE